MKRILFAGAAFALCALITTSALAQQAAAFRRFTTRDGKTFYAAVTGRNDLSVNLKLQDGRATVMPIRDLSQPDQQFVRKWTKFKDDLLNNAQFAKLTIKEMLEMRGYQSFEFDISGNHIYVEGELNGRPARFMVDTGADTSLLDVAGAKDAGVEIGPFDQVIRGIGGEAPAAVCKVTSIKLGDALIENRKILAADIFKNAGGNRDFQAIFGADFLRELDAVISYREGRMFLKPDNLKVAGAKPATPAAPGAAAAPAAAAGYAEFKRWTTSDGKSFVAALVEKTDTHATFRMQTGQPAPWPIDKLSDPDKDIVAKWDKLRDVLTKSPEWRTLTVKELLELRTYQSFAYRASGNHILVDGMVNTTKATFLIDTGAFSGVFHLPFAKQAGCEVGPMDQVIHGIGGNAPAALTKVARLSMGDAVIENRTLMSADLYKDVNIPGGKGDHDAIFGADFLRELDGVISYKEARIFLRPDTDKPGAAAAPVETPPAGTPGVPSPSTPAPATPAPAATTPAAPAPATPKAAAPKPAAAK